MIGLIRLLLMVAIVLPWQQISAHAVVTEHSLQITPIAAKKASRVQLTFNSQVERGI